MVKVLFGRKFLTFAIISCILYPSSVYGHGLGIDTISSVNVHGKEVSISVEIPMYFEKAVEKQITITAKDDSTKENAKNVTFLIGLFHENEMIFRNYFFTENGYLPITINPTQDGEVIIHGEKYSLLGAFHGTESNPISISGPIFESGGLYSFEIQIRTIDEPNNIIEDTQVYTADLSIVETTTHLQQDSVGNDVQFRMKSYFDQIHGFEYNPISKQVTFEMPFDWSEEKMSHVPVVHEEIHFPKDFAEFLYPSYVGMANGVELFKSSISVDDYTEEDERIVHFVLLQDHLRFIKNQMKKSGEPIPDKIVFVLSASEEVKFPLSAFTKSEDFRIDLSWDPLEIQPDQKTKFVFTIRDGKSGEPLRNSDYTFVIIQNGQEIHRISGTAQIGGEFEEYVFSKDQTGPTIVRFENIRNSGQETEFGFVVAPEFGTIALLILGFTIPVAILLSRKFTTFSI